MKVAFVSASFRRPIFILNDLLSLDEFVTRYGV